jgi:hypothetical protein
MTKARSNAVAEAAKGDLSVGTGTNLAGILPVGNSGEQIVADSSTSTGLRYNPQNALANPVINGGMDIWQRGTSFNGNAANYLADRWQTFSNADKTYSRQTTSDTTNLPNIQYALRLQRNNASTTTTAPNIYYSTESVNSIPFAGKTVTMSFYARKGANYSATGDAFGAQLVWGTGTDQNLATGGYTGATNAINQNVTLTTTWQRFAISATIGATATEFGMSYFFVPTGTAGANDWAEVTGVQIDLGTYTASTAPTFRRSGGTIQGELDACQRYYWRANIGGGDGYGFGGFGTAVATTIVIAQYLMPVEMRVTPTSIDYASLGVTANNADVIAVSSATLTTNKSNPKLVFINANLTGATQYRPYFIVANNSFSANIGFSAEL